MNIIISGENKRLSTALGLFLNSNLENVESVNKVKDITHIADYNDIKRPDFLIFYDSDLGKGQLEKIADMKKIFPTMKVIIIAKDGSGLDHSALGLGETIINGSENIELLDRLSETIASRM